MYRRCLPNINIYILSCFYFIMKQFQRSKLLEDDEIRFLSQNICEDIINNSDNLNKADILKKVQGFYDILIKY
jgi:hypothetical protein